MNLSERSGYIDCVHLFFLLDNSASTNGERIQELNKAMLRILPEVAATTVWNETTPLVHILSFSADVRWLCSTTAEHGIDARDIVWEDIAAEENPDVESTNTALAICSILPGLSRRLLGHFPYRPIIVLITDGHSGNRKETLAAIDELLKCQKTTCVAIGVSGYTADEMNVFASTGTMQKLIFPVDQAEEIAYVLYDLCIEDDLPSDIECPMKEMPKIIITSVFTDDEGGI
ncbi:MAG: vWA domain-containing protein [Clostridia bacterium]|nr:vWA domain-containing protein [Clostridia bacterium]